MSIENLGSTVYASCNGPDCYNQDPHAHQHFVYWPDAAGVSVLKQGEKP